MLEKGMQKVWKMMPKWSRKGATIHSKSIKCRKKGFPKINAKFDTEKDWNTMKNRGGKNMHFGAERHTVVKKQGSRGSVAERDLDQQIRKNP